MTRLAAILAAAMLALVIAIPAGASLNARYIANEYGEITVPAIDALATSILGQPVSVICEPTDPHGGADGWTWVTQDDAGRDVINPVVYITGDHCGELDNLLRYRQNPRWIGRNKDTADLDRIYSAGVAIATLEHELMHVALQSSDEGIVECTAMQNLWPSIKRLALPAWLNRELYLDAVDNHAAVADTNSAYGCSA